VIKVDGGELERRKEKMGKQRGFWTVDKVVIVIMAIGVLLFLFGAQLQTFTKTDINYSAYGGFLFLAGLILFAINRPEKRRR
jgi:hypothetical protein